MKLSLSILLPLIAEQATAFSQNNYLTARNSPVALRESLTTEIGASPVSEAAAEKGEPAPVLMDVTTDFNLEEKPDPKILDPKFRVQPGRYDDREMSIAIPFLKRPNKLDGSHAGDVGFDPLGLSETNDLYVMMEAEIRHARLAMLAVVGWPLSELITPKAFLHGENHLAPSVMNGFDPLSLVGVVAIFGALGFLEYQTAFRRVDDKPLGKIHTEDMANVWKYGVPGDYNFDPLNLYSILGDGADGRKALREAEVAHGRAAMLGITSFAILEKYSGHPIVENSVFFHPNALLPSLYVAYLVFGVFYDIESDGQYMFQPRMTSEGKVNLARLKNLFSSMTGGSDEGAADVADDLSTIASYPFKGLKDKFDETMKSFS